MESNFFHIFYELLAPKDTMDWGSGNAGFLIVNQDAKAEEYPTSQADGGVVGKCAKLQTVSTGSFGKMMNAPIAAGNLFTGSFQIDITKPRKNRHASDFLSAKMPTRLAGYYKYKAGETYTDKFSKVVEGKARRLRYLCCALRSYTTSALFRWHKFVVERKHCAES